MTPTLLRRCALALSILLLVACDSDLAFKNDQPVTVTVTEINANPEAYDGKLLAIEQPLMIANNYQLNHEQPRLLAVEGGRWYAPTQIAPPGQAAQQQLQDDRRRSLQLQADFIPYRELGFVEHDTDSLAAVRNGRHLSQIVGVLDLGEQGPVLRLTEQPQLDYSARPTAPAFEQDALTVAAFNLLNYFNGNGRGGDFPTERGAESLDAFMLQRNKLFAAMIAIDADLLALAELENDGFDEHSAITDLINGVNALLPEHKHYRAINIQPERLGSDAISNAIIYRPAVLEQIGQAATLTEPPFSINTRPALAASFRHIDSARPLTLVANHFKSKGSCAEAEGPDTDQNDGQGCFNATRSEAARVLTAWLETGPTGVEAPALLAGDFNAYANEDPITLFRQVGFERAIGLSGQERGHTYVFRGRAGSLDHILVAQALQDQLIGASTWPINADESRTLQYDQALDSPLANEPPTPWRSSDHDPLIAAFRMHD